MKVNRDIFNNFPLIDTQRIQLRPIELNDASLIYDMRSNGKVNQFIARDNMRSEKEAVALIEKTIEKYNSQEGIAWKGVLKKNGKMIGTCGFNSIDYPNLRAEIGGELSIDYWGKNIALEAVQAITNFGFEIMHLHSIEAKVSPGNRGAIYILECLGFEKEAHFKDRVFFNGKFYDMAVYSKLKP